MRRLRPTVPSMPRNAMNGRLRQWRLEMTPLGRQLRVIESAPEPEILRVAFATTDREYVNQHFGSAGLCHLCRQRAQRSRGVDL